MIGFFKLWFLNRRLLKEKKGDLELDQLGKLIIGLVIFLILLYFVSIFLGGKISDQEDEITGIFKAFG